MTIAKPGIAAGVVVASLAGMTLSSIGLPKIIPASICALCVLTSAMGAGIINSVLEQRTDALMPRLAGRVVALERIGPAKALSIALLLIAFSLTASFFYFSPFTCFLILLAVTSYAGLYTLYLKRRSPYGSVLGGIPGALPVLIGCSATHNGIGPGGLLLFFVMLMWQQPHFLAFALKYRADYEAAGIPIMPARLGEPYTKAFIFIYATALAPLTVSLWVFGYVTVWYALFSVAACGAFLSALYLYAARGQRYGLAFAASIVYIMAILGGVVVDSVGRNLGG